MPHKKCTCAFRGYHNGCVAAGKSRQTSSGRVFAKWIRNASHIGPAFTGSAFRDHVPGYPPCMPESDEVPIADAVEQQQETAASVPDEEASAEPPTDLPLETPGADWQEQLQEVVDDPEERSNDESEEAE